MTKEGLQKSAEALHALLGIQKPVSIPAPVSPNKKHYRREGKDGRITMLSWNEVKSELETQGIPVTERTLFVTGVRTLEGVYYKDAYAETSPYVTEHSEG